MADFEQARAMLRMAHKNFNALAGICLYIVQEEVLQHAFDQKC